MVNPEYQEKTTLTCLYGTFAFKRMSFGLWDAPATFQRCMTAIFSDLIENIMKVFMDDFSVYGCSFDNCLTEKSCFELGEMSLHGARRCRAWTPHLFQGVGSG